MSRGAMNVLVVGLDGSHESTTALEWASAALAPGGRLHAVHVLSPTEELALDAVLGDSVVLRHHREDELEQVWLAPVADAVADGAVTVLPSVVEGGVAESLLDIAAAVDADAVVVGHHPQARFGRRLVGLVAADLLHHAELPVVVVPGGWDPQSAVGLPVAVGAGPSDATRVALTWAMERAGALGSGLVLVHARGHRSLFSVDGLFDVLAYHLDRSVIPEWIEEDLLALADEVGRQTGADVDTTVAVERGRVGPRLVEAGERARMLVIGRSEPPFVGQHVMAPYLHHALAHAPCPIAVVPLDEGE